MRRVTAAIMLLSRSAMSQRAVTAAAPAAATAPSAVFMLQRCRRAAMRGAPSLHNPSPFSRGIAAASTGGTGRGEDDSMEIAAAAAGTGHSSGNAAPTSAELVRFLQGKLPQYCCGCGVRLQQKAEDLPGFFRIPRKLLDFAAQQALLLGMAEDAGDDTATDPEQRRRQALDRAAEEWLNEQQRPADVAGGGGDEDDEEENSAAVDVLCERCFGLKHEGKIRRPGAEALLPDFDLAKKVGRKIALQRDRRALVLVVVDVADFDGSLPRAALRALFPGIDPDAGDDMPEELPFKLMVAVNKFDLLPSQATPRRIEQWVRLRLRQAGLPRPEAVFPVSAVTSFGVKEMTARIRSDMGFRADLWVVGAQNAGKSSLINAMKRVGGTGGRSEPTVAPVPGTTLGLLRVPGIPLGPKQRVFDTPGVRHAYQLTTRLPLQEVAMILPRRRLKPRTWRVGAGSSLLLGGMGRVDVLSCPGPTLYLTAFISDDVVCHMGKTEGAEERRERHVGGQLVPPMTQERLEELGPLIARDTVVMGGGWDRSAVDVAIAGLGWVGVGVKGEARLRVWAPDGVAVTVHDALIPDFAKDFEKPGWSDLLPAKNRARAQQQAAAAAASSGAAAAAGSGGEDEEQEDEEAEGPAPKRATSRGGGRSGGSGKGRGSGRGSKAGGGRGGRGSKARAAGTV